EDQPSVLRLANEGVGASVERSQLCPRRAGTREEDAGRASKRGIEARATDDGSAFDAREDAVDEDRSGTHVRSERQALFAARRGDHVVSFGLEGLSQRFTKRDAVVDEQDR